MLLSVCSDYGLEHDIKFNSAKSNIMIFCCKMFKDIHVPSFELNDNILPRVNQCNILDMLSLMILMMIMYIKAVQENLCPG